MREAVVLAPPLPESPPSQAESTRVATLLEALPYMRELRGRVIVLCVDRDVLSTPESLARVARDIALLKFVGMAPVVVHGGAGRLSNFLTTATLPSAVAAQDATAELAKMVLVGNVNKDIVRALAGWGQKAFGLCGDDGGLFAPTGAMPEMSIDVGVLRKVGANSIPVIAGAGSNAQGGPVLIGMAELGRLVAVALGAFKLIYVVDLDAAKTSLQLGLGGARRAPAAAIQPWTTQLADPLREVVTSCCAAVEASVGAAHVVDARESHALLLELFTDGGIGLKVYP